MDLIKELLKDKNSTASKVVALAKKHNVKYKRTALDVFANKVSELSDSEVEQDDINDLIQALIRSDIISIQELTTLVTYHMREKIALEKSLKNKDEND